MTVGEKIKVARERNRLTQEELGQLCGTTKQTIFKYETGVITNIPLDRLEKIASILNVRPASLMGWEAEHPDLPLPDVANLLPLEPMGSVPLVGQIACGTPILAEENIEEYVDLPRHIKADFALSCKGDSMTGAGIQDGDVVYIHAQPEVENGQIAAVLVDSEEATLKRFYQDGATVQLVAENPKYPPLVFIGDGCARIRVLGRAVAFTHALP